MRKETDATQKNFWEGQGPSSRVSHPARQRAVRQHEVTYTNFLTLNDAKGSKASWVQTALQDGFHGLDQGLKNRHVVS